MRDAHAGLGMIALRQGRFGEAVANYESELRLQPDEPQLLYLLATSLEKDRQLDRALVQVQGLLARDPQHGEGRYLVGKILMAQGRAAEALQHLESAAQLRPGDYNVFYQLGLALQRNGRPQESQRAFERYRSLKENGGASGDGSAAGDAGSAGGRP